MKKSAEHVLFFLFLLSLVVSSSAGTVYYVNGANGSDAGPGTQAYPWKTIQKAANTMRAGDGTIVSAGTYPERITASTSGTSGALITFPASGTVECRGFTVRADFVRLQGFKITTLPIQASAFEIGYGTWITGKYCIVENIFAYNCVRGGICLRPESANGIVRNNRCQRNGMVGIEIHGTNHLVENNEIWGSICIPPPELPSSVNVVYNQVLHAIYLTGTTFTGLDIGYNCVYNSDGTIPTGRCFLTIYGL